MVTSLTTFQQQHAGPGGLQPGEPAPLAEPAVGGVAVHDLRDGAAADPFGRTEGGTDEEGLAGADTERAPAQ